MEYGSLKEVLSDYGQHVTPMQLYSDMFRIGEGYIQRSGDSRDFKANPLGYYRNIDDEKVSNIILDDFRTCKLGNITLEKVEK